MSAEYRHQAGKLHSMDVGYAAGFLAMISEFCALTERRKGPAQSSDQTLDRLSKARDVRCIAHMEDHDHKAGHRSQIGGLAETQYAESAPARSLTPLRFHVTGKARQPRSGNRWPRNGQGLSGELLDGGNRLSGSYRGAVYVRHDPWPPLKR